MSGGLFGSQEEERSIFSNIIVLDIFLLVAILYLVDYVPNGPSLGKVWMLEMVIALLAVLLLRILSAIMKSRFLKIISYICLAISVIAQLYIIFVLI